VVMVTLKPPSLFKTVISFSTLQTYDNYQLQS